MLCVAPLDSDQSTGEKKCSAEDFQKNHTLNIVKRLSTNYTRKKQYAAGESNDPLRSRALDEADDNEAGQAQETTQQREKL
jgi:hypothetical protein